MIVQSLNGKKTLIRQPSECPYCHNTITPVPEYSYSKHRILYVFMACPNDSCTRGFVATYQPNASGEYIYDKVLKPSIKGKTFSDTINTISPAFYTIYNQAYAAEQQGLLEICGVGYRKALEFLIKDYAISKNPADKDKIEALLLGKCINEYVTDHRIKDIAKRAVWLGNDHTHYVKKWEGKNLEDLKKLIEITLHWLEMV